MYDYQNEDPLLSPSVSEGSTSFAEKTPPESSAMIREGYSEEDTSVGASMPLYYVDDRGAVIQDVLHCEAECHPIVPGLPEDAAEPTWL